MNDAEFLILFNELENVEPVDAYTDKIITQAHDLEKLINGSVESDQTELDELDRADLEKEWMEMMDDGCPYLYKDVVVTGEVSVAYRNDQTGEFDIEKVPYNQQVVRSYGFGTLQVADELGNERYVVGHVFQVGFLPPQSTTAPLVDYLPRLYAFAPVGSVEIMADLPAEQNIELLTKNIPELLDDIDCAILNADSEGEALMQLQTVAVSKSEDIPNDILTQLLHYVHERLDFDEKIPYKVQLSGLAYNEDDEANMTLVTFGDEPVEVLAYPLDLQLINYPGRDKKQELSSNDLHWSVRLRIISAARNDDDEMVIVPVHNISSMVSMRDISYKTANLIAEAG
jgi:hypothetical protein